MGLKYLLLLMCIHMACTEMEINIHADVENVYVETSGQEQHLVDESDRKLFKIQTEQLKAAVQKHYGRWPNDVYVRSPTPWGDLYKSYGWDEVMRVITIKSAKVRHGDITPTILVTKNFVNNSTKTMKLDTSVSHTVHNSYKISWKKEKKFTVSQKIDYGINLIFVKGSGSTSFSYTSTWGESEERSEAVTIGSTSGVKTVLEPGQAVTAVLAVNAGYLEIDVEYEISLAGIVAVNYKQPYNGHHFWGPRIEDVMESGKIANDLIQVETIKATYHSNATLTIYDKNSNNLMRSINL